MPEVKEYTIYTFDELSDDAKETARDWYRAGDTFSDMFEVSDFIAVAELLGILFNSNPVKLGNGDTRWEPKIYWSGFSSQGDGACFEGTYRYAKGAVAAITKYTGGTDKELIRIATELQRAQKNNFYQLRARCAHQGRYYHSGCMSVEVEDNRDSWREIPRNDADTVEQAMRDFADWMYRQIEREYEYQMSDEVVDETIRINGYTFDEDGNRED